jgi:N-acetylglucosaminyldiphosphoundecaprenol N-acetyl-beta-D-mannosaminyltransferase
MEREEIKKVTILGVPFINTNRKDFVALLKKRMKSEKKTFVITANPEIIMKAKVDPEYMDIIHQATYVTADGIGVVKAAQLLNEPLPERVAGFDTMMDLLEVANQERFRIYLLGATQSVLERVMARLAAEYPNVEIIGAHNGFFDWEDESIAREIRELEPDLVFVALGVPKQEQWIARHFDSFEKGIFMGLGGSFDILAGEVPRAPEAWQRMNVEWLYRLVNQPSRWRRMLALPHFAWKVLIQRLKGY